MSLYPPSLRPHLPLIPCLEILLLHLLETQIPGKAILNIALNTCGFVLYLNSKQLPLSV